MIAMLLVSASVAAFDASAAPSFRFPYMPDNIVVGCTVQVVSKGVFRTPPAQIKATGRHPARKDPEDWMKSVSERYGEPSAVLEAPDCYADRRIVVYADDPSTIDPDRLANVDKGPMSPYCDGTPPSRQDAAVQAALAIPQPIGQAFYVILSSPSTGRPTERIVHVDWTNMARNRSLGLTNRNCPRLHN